MKFLILLSVFLSLAVVSSFTISPTSNVKRASTIAVFTTANKSITREQTELTIEEEWQMQLESEEVKEVRGELIQKYINKGKTLEYASKEVDQFLSDPNRSQQFLEMRRYAKRQNDLGFEFGVQLVGAFMIGLLGQIAMKYFSIVTTTATETATAATTTIVN